MALYAGTCECHLCWKPQTAFLFRISGRVLCRVLDGHRSMSWGFGMTPLLLPFLRFCTTICTWPRSLDWRAWEKAHNIRWTSSECKREGHSVHWAYIACSLLQVKFGFAPLLAVCVKALGQKTTPFWSKCVLCYAFCSLDANLHVKQKLTAILSHSRFIILITSILIKNYIQIKLQISSCIDCTDSVWLSTHIFLMFFLFHRQKKKTWLFCILPTKTQAHKHQTCHSYTWHMESQRPQWDET